MVLFKIPDTEDMQTLEQGVYNQSFNFAKRKGQEVDKELYWQGFLNPSFKNSLRAAQGWLEPVNRLDKKMSYFVDNGDVGIAMGHYHAPIPDSMVLKPTRQVLLPAQNINGIATF